MGNSHSAEAPWRGQRTTQKLSKPKTGNPTAAGLLSPLGPSNSARPSPVARRLSLPHTSSSPTISPILPETNPTATANVPGDKKSSGLGSRLSRGLFRSNTSKEFRIRRHTSSSVEVPVPQQELWSSGADSFRNGPGDGYNHSQAHIQGSLSMNVSRSSFSNYEPGTYEAQRLLNLVEVPSHEDQSVVSENQMHISEAVQAEFRGRRPSIPEVTTTITRNGSEVSLYTPMRRRSLMTPGVATREVRADPGPSKPRVRHSLPSTPSRRESMESMAIGSSGFLLLENPELIPRALTPCEAEYKQTGAFRLGTLRITNGSPARSPVRDPKSDIKRDGHSELSNNELKEDYFGTEKSPSNGNTKMDLNAIQEKTELLTTEQLDSTVVPSLPSIAHSTTATQPQVSSQIVSERQMGPPLSNDETLKIPQIQVTSKHTAAEDRLFDDDQNEFSSVEVLDVRIDPNAKPAPPRPKPMPERKEINRSDSGIASPGSEYSAAPLSKADSGYSSNVSLRSFSTRPSAAEKDRNSDIEVDVLNNGTRSTVHIREPELRSPTTAVNNAVSPSPLDGISPPPVPEKDPHLMALASPKTLNERSPSSPQSPRFMNNTKYNQLPERTLSPSSARGQVSRSIGSRQFVSMNPITSNSPLSISTGFRKPGKLQRFLSGNRTSLVVHNTHSSDYASVPVVPGDLQEKLQTHAGMMPISFRRLALKSAASKETLGTILSVGSAELLQDDDVSPTNRSQGTSIPLGSTIANPRPTSVKKPIPRKPVPMRVRDVNTVEVSAKASDVSSQALSPRGNAGEAYSLPGISATGRRSRYSAPIPRLNKANTMTSGIEEDLGMLYADMGHDNGFTQGKSYSTTSLALPSAPNVKLAKSPPPVSMRTRNMGPLRVAPPARSQSTPPENMIRLGRSQSSRRGSRDGSFKGPGFDGGFAPNHSLGPRSSRESFRNPPSVQAYPHADKPSTGHMSLGAEPTQARAPNWDVRVDHGPSLSRQPSTDSSRRSSLVSQSSQRTSASIGPGFFQHQHHSQPNLSALHRRSSYDEYNIVPQDSCIRDNGPYPSISRNGQSYVSDPWSGRSMSMPQQWDQQWDQPHREPQYTPRPHYRRRSVDQYGNPTPYRILHSYNSPAYRHVPIWR
ncbi:uncharacterized protein F4822DRAFT_425595 [Hypoxylon trugodes]|uniref:uncharacterized protein n=1 Tax=Hypoxylon trugodes TaxID=326681 RepID=UPI0021A0B4A1|nr:uncharacterized protein F4822DRAFT_425595 [Hypoxylon trugodes]KAI1392386.1 hypothetical protein F4822DRAFT_425595 [Hypoxylon trugodes]